MSGFTLLCVAPLAVGLIGFLWFVLAVRNAPEGEERDGVGFVAKGTK